MKFKRTVGTGKIFLYSCGAVVALAGIIWLIVNGVFAVYISGEEPSRRWSWSVYEQTSVDIVTPWLLMAAAMAIYYRYWKMCNANNVSCAKQTGVFSLLSVFVPPVFAAADLLAAKLVFESLYGGIVLTRFEDGSTYFLKYLSENSDLLKSDNLSEISSPYMMKIMLLIFALMTMYYYCFFITGWYIMHCIKCSRKKTLIYYAVTLILGILIVLYVEKIDSAFDNEVLTAILVSFVMWFIFIGALTNPVIFLVVCQYLTKGNLTAIIDGFIMMTVFIFITIPNIEALGLKQFPSKRKIKKILKNYNAKITAEREEKINDGQT